MTQENVHRRWLVTAAGTGIAFGYSSATPAALKWYPPTKTGKIAGIVVSGFGLASVYIAPLAKYLLNQWGLQQSMLFFGVAFLVVVSFLALFLINPPAGYEPSGFVCRRSKGEAGVKARTLFKDTDATPWEMIKSPEFWPLWVLYFIGAGAGLMVIGSVAGMAKASLGEKAFYAVAILAAGNAGGRIAAGVLSERIGRRKTLAAMFSFQALLMFAAIPITGSASVSPFLLVLIATGSGFNYGANLALFPSFTKDHWGMKNFGVNYGILFTAWGMGGLVMSRTSQALVAESGSYGTAFLFSGILLILGVFIIIVMRDRKEELRATIKNQETPLPESSQLVPVTVSSREIHGKV